MADTLKTCPQCASPYGYFLREDTFACPECGHEWNPAESPAEEMLVVKDANGNLLQDGDTVIVIKNLPVKGASAPIKAGTKVKNIRLSEESLVVRKEGSSHVRRNIMHYNLDAVISVGY